ncbi:porin [Paraburkholderia dipogonis]|uniref:Porin n=1 Tax=Paraburkholderia dipogonis TaxID=1211383 RepID=A0A4Y8MW58_9BURK|nr:porin [Paraburkholderia dipogonis]TFE41553.1 porin [Paraburkholderia dipogonis]
MKYTIESLTKVIVISFCAISATTFGLKPALAQSSLQLYGQIDEWVGARKWPGGQTAALLAGGGLSTSYWGLKGSENLGNGSSAIFALESFFQPQNGGYGSYPGDTFFSRNAYVGIESPYGTLTAGHLTTQLFISTLLFNPFVDSYVFSPMIQHTYLGLGTFPSYNTDQGSAGGFAWNNALQYSTPAFGGWSGAIMYGLGNAAGQNGAKKWSGEVTYSGSELSATAVYQYVNFNAQPGDLSSLVTGLKSQSIGQIGLSYDLKFVKFFGQYMYTCDTQQSGSWHVQTGQGGVAVPLGVGTLMASVAYSRDSGGLDQTRKSAAIGYDYPLSKRTDVYAAYLYDHFNKQSSGQTYGVGIRAKF